MRREILREGRRDRRDDQAQVAGSDVEDGMIGPTGISKNGEEAKEYKTRGDC